MAMYLLLIFQFPLRYAIQGVRQTLIFLIDGIIDLHENCFDQHNQCSLQLLYGFVQHQSIACISVRVSLQQYIESFRTSYIEELRSVDPTSVINPSV